MKYQLSAKERKRVGEYRFYHQERIEERNMNYEAKKIHKEKYDSNKDKDV